MQAAFKNILTEQMKAGFHNLPADVGIRNSPAWFLDNILHLKYWFRNKIYLPKLRETLQKTAMPKVPGSFCEAYS